MSSVIVHSEPPLITAVFNQDIDQVKTLLKLGADPLEPKSDKDKATSIDFALWGQNNEIKKLIANHRYANGDTVLITAIWNQDEQQVKNVLLLGADPSAAKNDGTLPITFAKWRGNKTIENLITNAVKIFARTRLGALNVVSLERYPVATDVFFGPEQIKTVIGVREANAIVYSILDLKRKGKLCSLELEKDDDLNRGIQFGPDGKLVLAISNKTAKVWDSTNCKLLFTLRDDQNLTLHGAKFSPDGNRIVTTFERGVAKIWDAKDGKLLKTLLAPIAYVESDVTSAFVSPDGSLVAANTITRAIPEILLNTLIWDSFTGQLLYEIENKHIAAKFDAFSPDSTRLIVGTDVYNARSGQLLFSINLPRGWKDYILFAFFSKDGQKIIAANSKGVLMAFSATDIFNEDVDTCVAVSATKGEKRTVIEFFARPIWRKMQDATSFSGHVSMSADGRKLLTCSPYGGNVVQVWDIADGKLIETLAPAEGKSVGDAYISGDGQWIVISLPDQLKLYEFAPKHSLKSHVLKVLLETYLKSLPLDSQPSFAGFLTQSKIPENIVNDLMTDIDIKLYLEALFPDAVKAIKLGV